MCAQVRHGSQIRDTLQGQLSISSVLHLDCSSLVAVDGSGVVPEVTESATSTLPGCSFLLSGIGSWSVLDLA